MSEMKKALAELSDQWVDESLTNPDESKPFNQLIPGPVRKAMLSRFKEDQFGNQVKIIPK